MSTAAERAKAKAARMASAVRAAPVLTDDDERGRLPASVRSSSHPARAVRSETIKTSVHLAPELHREFTAWCLEAARELERGRVNGSDVVRVLLRRLLADEELQAEVVEALRSEGRR